MIIEIKALYEAMQTSFSQYHPKFPWPKRHDLEDQTDDFKNAFLDFAQYVDDTIRAEVLDRARIEKEHYEEKLSILQTRYEGAKWWNTFYLFALGIIAGAFVVGIIVGNIIQ